MKLISFKTTNRSMAVCLLAGMLVTSMSGCLKDHNFPLSNYKTVVLVANSASYGAATIDDKLLNAWGIAVAPSGPLWIASNHGSVSTVYNRSGLTLLPPVTIPSHGKSAGGAPTGVIFNPTPDFVIPSSGSAAKFIFAGEDGIISAWNGGSSAVAVADRSTAEAVYKGIAMANFGGHNFLYATDFRGGKIDVFNDHFVYLTSMLFKDPSLPNHFAPFNIKNIKGLLFVTYAKQKGPDNEDDEAGPGNGFIDIFNPAGAFVKRFASHGPLNSPWGMATSTRLFHDIPDALLVGNFGDGTINVYEPSGAYRGPLKMNGNPISIEGLWAIENNVPGGNPKQLFFTAGPADEEDGLFGYIEKQ